MNTIIIAVQPVPVWTNDGTTNAVGFRVSTVAYDSNTGASTGFFTLLDVAGKILVSSSVMASPAQTASWTDDAAFYRVLAQNAGLTPV